GLWGTRVSGRERTLLAFMAPRGIVAAAVTSIFALGFEDAARDAQQRAAAATGIRADDLQAHADRLAALSEQTGQLVPLVFIVIVCTVAIYGFAVGRIGGRLGLANASPQGVLFAGVGSWVVDAARLLQEEGVATR